MWALDADGLHARRIGVHRRGLGKEGSRKERGQVKHASFFSGVGGLDLGFERAGIETVSVSEIDPYANAVLAERFPDAPNLGSITEVDANDIPEADIWSGGFPCQDLSVAGKRAGFAGKRSSLAFTFLDLVEQRRPRWLVLENVPGLFSSNKGADFGRLLYEMEQLGYGVSWRTLDARYFGVAQRRRRVFIVASLESDRAGEVLFECEGCERHPATRRGKWETITSRIADCAAKSSRGDDWTRGSSPDAYGVRAPDGMAGRMDSKRALETFGAKTHRELQARDWKVGVSNQDLNKEGYLVGSLTGGGAYSPQSERIFDERGLAPTLDTGRAVPQVFRKSTRGTTATQVESWIEAEAANTLNNFDVGDARTTHAVIGSGVDDDRDLPRHLDGHRYRCCGNGVVAPVAEWIGRGIVEVDRRWREEEAK